MIRNKWRPGRHLVFCDRCGMTYYDDQTAKEWNGAIVCRGPGTRDCFEERHPVDFLRSREEDIAVEDARPRNIDRTNG